jgi:hypothetical protein
MVRVKASEWDQKCRIRAWVKVRASSPNPKGYVLNLIYYTLTIELGLDLGLTYQAVKVSCCSTRFEIIICFIYILVIRIEIHLIRGRVRC